MTSLELLVSQTTMWLDVFDTRQTDLISSVLNNVQSCLKNITDHVVTFLQVYLIYSIACIGFAHHKMNPWIWVVKPCIMSSKMTSNPPFSVRFYTDRIRMYIYTCFYMSWTVLVCTKYFCVSQKQPIKC